MRIEDLRVSYKSNRSGVFRGSGHRQPPGDGKQIKGRLEIASQEGEKSKQIQKTGRGKYTDRRKRNRQKKGRRTRGKKKTEKNKEQKK